MIDLNISDGSAPLAEWEFVLALPNLTLRAGRQLWDPTQWPDGIDFGGRVVAIMGGDDDAVTRIRHGNYAVDCILRSFKDEHGSGYVPAVIVLHHVYGAALRANASAFNDFRNAVALCFVLRGRSATARGYGSQDPTWGDVFDFHPAQISSTGRVILQSPALNIMIGDGAKSLNLGPSPAVSVFTSKLHVDHYLYRALGLEWQRRYVKPANNTRYSRTLFRALEVAYHACSVGVKSFGSAVEYGTQIALWVSAMEILAWPTNQRADLFKVFDLLERAPANRALTRRSYRAKWGGQKRSINAIQRCYRLMYSARNHFLHGDPVSFRTLMGKSGATDFALPRVASLVFRYALVAYLRDRHLRAEDNPSFEDSDLFEMIEDQNYDEALAEVLDLTLKKRAPDD